MTKKLDKKLEAAKLELADRMSPGTISYHIRQVLDQLVRLYDLVAGGYYRYYDLELASTNLRMSSEIEKRTHELNRLKGCSLVWNPPFPNFSVDVVCNSWFQIHKQRVRDFRFDVEAIAPVSEGPLSQQCTVFCFQIGKKIDEYEKSKYKYEVEQFGWFYRENQRKIEEQSQTQDRTFPKEDFEFVGDLSVRLTLCTYYQELRQLYFAAAPISSIILAGALIEALLLEAIRMEPDNARTSYLKLYPGREVQDLANWRLAELIDVALGIGVLPNELRNQMNSVRSFRNFVHISKAASSGIQLGESYKEICKNALAIVLNHARIWATTQRIIKAHNKTQEGQ